MVVPMNNYLYMLILSMYEKPTNTGQVHNVLIGRSTPSILFVVELNQWHKFYGILGQIKRQRVDQLHKDFLSKQVIEPQESKFTLSQKGRDLVDQFFTDHVTLWDDGNFQTQDYYDQVWQLVQFTSQVISEKTYHNATYIPFKKDLQSQQFIKKLKASSDHFQDKWIEEQTLIFSKLPDLYAKLLANSLIGHQVNGLTLRQLARALDLSNSEAYFAQLEAYKTYYALAKNEGLNLHSQLFQFTALTSSYGLTASAYDTYMRLKQGQSLSQIARMKGVKDGTVKEHVLEIAFKCPEIKMTPLVPQARADWLRTYFNDNPDRSYKEAVDQVENLEFYHYRLIELEVMRGES